MELGDGAVLIKDGTSGEPVGLEVLSYRLGDGRFDAVSVELGQIIGHCSTSFSRDKLCKAD